MYFSIDEIITVSFTLFAVIDIIGSIPVLVSIQEKMGEPIATLRATVASGILMVLFFFIGGYVLKFLGVRVTDFAA
jgi:multiple antibiotic resistance protein